MSEEKSALPMDFNAPMPQKRVRRGGIYDKTIQAFEASGKSHAKIGGEASVQSRYLGLRNAIERAGLGKKIAVSRAAGEVWLLRR